MEKPTRESVRALIIKKDELEVQIRTIEEQLTSSGGPGVRGSLVDSQGFPRNDIDIFAIRRLRNELATLQTDYSELMHSIEIGMAAIFSGEVGPMISHKDVPMKSEQVPPKAPQVFAMVNSVAMSSPAHEAGLLHGDYIVRFGSATRENHRYDSDNYVAFLIYCQAAASCDRSGEDEYWS